MKSLTSNMILLIILLVEHKARRLTQESSFSTAILSSLGKYSLEMSPFHKYEKRDLKLRIYCCMGL